MISLGKSHRFRNLDTAYIGLGLVVTIVLMIVFVLAKPCHEDYIEGETVKVCRGDK